MSEYLSGRWNNTDVITVSVSPLGNKHQKEAATTSKTVASSLGSMSGKRVRAVRVLVAVTNFNINVRLDYIIKRQKVITLILKP